MRHTKTVRIVLVHIISNIVLHSSTYYRICWIAQYLSGIHDEKRELNYNTSKSRAYPYGYGYVRSYAYNLCSFDCFFFTIFPRKFPAVTYFGTEARAFNFTENNNIFNLPTSQISIVQT
jgi:hypothetical protein